MDLTYSKNCFLLVYYEHNKLAPLTWWYQAAIVGKL